MLCLAGSPLEPLSRVAPVSLSEPRRATDAHGSTSAGVARRFRWVAYKTRKRPDTGANASAPAAEERSTFAGTALASSLVQKPGTSLGLVDPDFDQAGGGNVAMFFADVVRFAQTGGEFLVVLAHFGEHVLRLDIVDIVVLHALYAADMPDGLKRGSTDLAYPLGDGIGHREQLIRLLIEQQMVITEVRATHVPVEILGFHIEREYVGQDGIHGTGDVLGRSGLEVGRRGQWSAESAHEIFSVSFHDVPRRNEICIRSTDTRQQAVTRATFLGGFPRGTN